MNDMSQTAWLWAHGASHLGKGMDELEAAHRKARHEMQC